MDKILNQISNGQPTPPDYFWYTLSLILCAALIYVIINYTRRIDTILAGLSKAIAEIAQIVKVHEREIKDNKRDIEKLEAKVFK